MVLRAEKPRRTLPVPARAKLKNRRLSGDELLDSIAKRFDIG